MERNFIYRICTVCVYVVLTVCAVAAVAVVCRSRLTAVAPAPLTLNCPLSSSGCQSSPCLVPAQHPQTHYSIVPKTKTTLQTSYCCTCNELCVCVWVCVCVRTHWDVVHLLFSMSPLLDVYGRPGNVGRRLSEICGTWYKYSVKVMRAVLVGDITLLILVPHSWFYI